jgi:hypothetical protein
MSAAIQLIFFYRNQTFLDNFYFNLLILVREINFCNRNFNGNGINLKVVENIPNYLKKNAKKICLQLIKVELALKPLTGKMFKKKPHLLFSFQKEISITFDSACKLD